jgi:hypothetical protein
MSLTTTLVTQDVFGNKRMNCLNLAFDSSYPTGGEALAAQTMGLLNIDYVQFEPSEGFTFSYDHTNNKVQAYQVAPPIVFEEVVTVTSDVGVLMYPAVFIMSVSASTTHYHPIPGGITPAAGQVSVSNYTPTFTPGTTSLTFRTADSVTTCVVTYATQSWKSLVDNYVYAKITAGARVYGHASLTFTPGGTDEVDLGEAAVAIGSITWSDNGVIKEVNPIAKGATAATKEVALDWSDSTNVTLNFLASDTMDAAADSIYIVYIKKPTTGYLSTHFVEDSDSTPSTDVCTFAPTLVDGQYFILWGTSGTLAGPTTKFNNIVASTATIGSGATDIQPTKVFVASSTWTAGSSHADTDHVFMSGICGKLDQIRLIPCECAAGTDLSGFTDVRGFVIGS